MKIRFFADWCQSDECRRQFILMYGEIAGDLITTGSDFTHVIILNCAMPNIPSNIPKKNVIGFAYEPLHFLNLTPQFIEYAKRNISRYFIGKVGDLPPPFEEGYGYLWHKTLTHVPLPKTNTSPISLMVSQKKMLGGHRYRYLLANQILKRDLPIDIWGRGVPLLKQIFGDKPQLKRLFAEEETALYDGYKFSIAIENSEAPAYVSEKFTNCLVTGTIPIYMGCPNVENFFGKDCCIFLKGDLDADIALLEDICKSPEKYMRPVNTDILRESPKVNLYQAIVTGIYG